MALKDEPLEFIIEQYHAKNNVLSNYGEQVSSYTLYENIYKDMEQEVPLVIIDENEGKHILKSSVEEAVEYCKGRNDVLLGGSTYFNGYISKKTAKDIHAFIIDMDNVYDGLLNTALMNDWNTEHKELPKPTYIVNSGTGCHLYFLLSEPIPNYKSMTIHIDRLYRKLAEQQTTARIYHEKQVQWFGQDFRMAGGLNKYDLENTVYRIGDKWDIDELARAVGYEGVHFTRYGDKRAFKGDRDVNTKKRKYNKKTGWKTNRSFYDYTLKNCFEKTKEGNRYTSMCALTVIAYKCGVNFEELEQDLLSLIPKYNDGANRRMKDSEIKSAVKMYNDKAILTQRQRLEDWQGWEFKPIKRNGRKQLQHLERARAVQKIDYPNDEWRNKEGRPSVEEYVYEWQKQNPEGKKIECHRETKLDPKTIRKWWRSKEEMEEKIKQKKFTRLKNGLK